MEILTALSDWSVAAFLRSNGTAYLLVNAAHILALGGLVGGILALDLRLLGAFKAAPVAVLAPVLVRTAAWSLAAALLTGFLLFAVRPTAYVVNPAFLAKLGLVGLGIVNVVLVHRSRAWKAAFYGGTPQAGLRISAALSLMLWTGAVVAGRWIGFL